MAQGVNFSEKSHFCEKKKKSPKPFKFFSHLSVDFDGLWINVIYTRYLESISKTVKHEILLA